MYCLAIRVGAEMEWYSLLLLSVRQLYLRLHSHSHSQTARPGTGLASPEGTSALIGTSEYSFSSKSTSKVVYHVPIPSHGSAASFITTQPTELVRNTTSAVFLSEDEAAYVIGNTLYAKSTKKPDADDKGTKAGEFPAPVDNLVAVGAGEEGVTLVFSAEVYDDGVLENMPKHDKSEVEEEWSRVKGMSAFISMIMWVSCGGK